MNLKYISVGVLAVIIALFYFMHQSNEASAERLKQAEIANQQRLEQEKESISREQKEAKKLAEKERHEQASYGSPSTSDNIVSEFNACRGSAILAKSQLAGTQYKSKVIMDSTDGYIVRICTNDGSVLITCDASNGKMVESKSSICSLDS